jgi:succinate-semialdehyde dehydrogenase/glutarate-semialdehyde dehydrogenase
MPYVSLNPATNTTLKTYASWNSNNLADALRDAFHAHRGWSRMTFTERIESMNRAAALFRERIDEYARLMAIEMGKPLCEGRAEVEKCALACDFYAVHAEQFMRTEMVQTDAGKS